MDQERLDNLARSLAEPLPRRSVVKMLIAGLFGIGVGFRRVSRAHAAPGCNNPDICGKGSVCGTEAPPGKDGKTACVKHCCYGHPDQTAAVCCKYGPDVNGYALGWCCERGFTCGQADLTTRQAIGNVCICNGTVNRSGRHPVCECAPERTCGETCCKPGQECIRGRCEYICNTVADRRATRIYDPETQCCAAYGIEPKDGNFNVVSCEKTLSPRPGYKPDTSKYYCGSPDARRDDVFKPAKGKPASFLPACKAHDACYDRCGSDKAQCDVAFHDAMKKACTSRYWSGATQQACIAAANTYHDAVMLFGGDAFEAAQRAACRCCK